MAKVTIRDVAAAAGVSVLIFSPATFRSGAALHFRRKLQLEPIIGSAVTARQEQTNEANFIN